MSNLKTALGLMSGTSMDGIDLAVIQTDGETRVVRGFASASLDYSPHERDQLEAALEQAKAIKNRDARPGSLGETEAMLTRRHAELVQSFLAKHGADLPSIDVIGFHGQTVLHRPDEALTVQLGDGQMLAEKTGIPTVFDMRANDMAHGGQGAPLVPVYHQALAQNLPDAYRDMLPVAFVNIGGISNISYVDRDELIAFDCGPGNALIDQWVQRHVGIPYDADGRIAAEGEVAPAFVKTFLNDPFFNRKVPKSLDRNDFQLPAELSLGVETVARSLARVSAEAIFRATDHLPKPPKLWIISGGGAKNPHIMQDLRELTEKTEACVIDAGEVQLDGDMMEAEAWAYLAVRSMRGLPLTYPRTTGCKMPVPGGIHVMP